MMENWTQQEVEQVILECQKKSAVDAKFRELMKQNVREAILTVCGKAVPAEIKIKVQESDPDYDFTIVLPPVLIDTTQEMDDDALENVVGGTKVYMRASSKNHWTNHKNK